MARFGPGEVVFIVEAGNAIREVVIKCFRGGFYTIQTGNSKGFKVKPHRLYGTREEAEKAIAERGYRPRGSLVEKYAIKIAPHMEGLQETASSAAVFGREKRRNYTPLVG